MPQMSPMDWIMLMIYFFLVYFLFLINIYFYLKIFLINYKNFLINNKFNYKWY